MIYPSSHEGKEKEKEKEISRKETVDKNRSP